MSDFPDLADRAHWRKLFAGQSVQLARHEVDLKEQYDAVQEMKTQAIHRAAEFDAFLATFAELRHAVEEAQVKVAALSAAHDKLIEHLRVRFAELRAEMNGHLKEPSGNSS